MVPGRDVARTGAANQRFVTPKDVPSGIRSEQAFGRLQLFTPLKIQRSNSTFKEQTLITRTCTFGNSSRKRRRKSGRYYGRITFAAIMCEWKMRAQHAWVEGNACTSTTTTRCGRESKFGCGHRQTWTACWVTSPKLPTLVGKDLCPRVVLKTSLSSARNTPSGRQSRMHICT